MTNHPPLDTGLYNDDWKIWGPYLSERAWGNVREDYTPDGNGWPGFPFEHSHARAYRWTEDGIGGFCNRSQDICLSAALWNEYDPVLKERIFGLSNNEGNHGEDVKEYFYYLDASPNYAYAKMLYRYPQVRYPYEGLKLANQKRSNDEPELELIHVLRHEFEQNRYFDVFIEYAKADIEDVLCRIVVINRGDKPAPIHVLPHVWFRNTWAWGDDVPRPFMNGTDGDGALLEHPDLGQYWWMVQADGVSPTLLFTENETNTERLFSQPNATPFTKDGINEAVVHGRSECVNPERRGTKCAAHFQAVVAPGESFTVRVRFAHHPVSFSDFDAVFERRIQETNEFYANVQRKELSDDERQVQRQAFAGLLWSKMFYHYDVGRWLDGDGDLSLPEDAPRQQKNANWRHLRGHDVLSIPDKWEYSWFAAWDLAFQVSTLCVIDHQAAKRQLILLLNERYMHPQGMIPAFEGGFDKQNPPVHAWAAWHVYDIERDVTGQADTIFLERVFHKLLLNYSWWMNCTDSNNDHVHGGGFLGMDNISLFDRNDPPAKDGTLDQADGTGWMAFYALSMFLIALELSQHNPAYEDMAIRFVDDFVNLAQALNEKLWDEGDGFFYDVLQRPRMEPLPLKIRSYAGLVPMLAVQTVEPQYLEKAPRLREYLRQKHDYIFEHDGEFLLAMLPRERLERMLATLFDPNEFLSEQGIRSLSKYHEQHPVSRRFQNKTYSVKYEPGDAKSNLMGGNSNWRGPIWAPINHLLIEALRQYHVFYQGRFSIELPTGSGRSVTLESAAQDLCRRLVSMFLKDESGKRPVFGHEDYFQNTSDWNDCIWFYEHFHGDGGWGLGASHQNGWTALVAKLIQDGGRRAL